MNQRGVAESTQWTILLPVVLSLVLGLIELGVWLQARSVAAQAASAVADVRAAGAGSAQAARQAGRRIARAGGLKSIRISITEAAGQLVVQVSGEAPLPVPLNVGRIQERAVLPVERPAG